MDRVFRNRFGGTEAQNWWRTEMRWDTEEGGEETEERGDVREKEEDSGMESGDGDEVRPPRDPPNTVRKASARRTHSLESVGSTSD